jgi:hypothetical protein
MADPVKRNELGVREPALDVLGFAVVNRACESGTCSSQTRSASARTTTHGPQCRAGSGLAGSKGRPAAFSGHRSPQSDFDGAGVSSSTVGTSEHTTYHSDLVLCGHGGKESERQLGTFHIPQMNSRTVLDGLRASTLSLMRRSRMSLFCTSQTRGQPQKSTATGLGEITADLGIPDKRRVVPNLLEGDGDQRGAAGSKYNVHPHG